MVNRVISIWLKNNNMTEEITTPYSYTLAMDLRPVMMALGQDCGIEQEKQLTKVVETYRPAKMDFRTTDMTEVYDWLVARAQDFLTDNLNSGVIVCDRFVPSPSGNTFRLDLCRNPAGKLTNRPGTPESDKQILLLKNWLKEKNLSQLLLVDDVLARGETAAKITNLVRQNKPDINIQAVFGAASFGGNDWSGLEKFQAQTGIAPETFMTIKAGDKTPWSTGMAFLLSRDFTILGGSIQDNQNYPYFLPFNVPKTAIFPRENLLPASLELLQFNADLFRQTNLTFSEINRAGFATAGTQLKFLKESFANSAPKEFVLDFIDYCQNLLANPKLSSEFLKVMYREGNPAEAEVMVLDMDGTLYPFDNPSNTYSGSSLEKQVLENAAKFCGNKKLVENCLRNKVPLSRGISQALNISREQYFNQVWGELDPAQLISDSSSGNVVRAIAEKRKQLIVLSSSPKVWVDKVLKYLEIDNCLSQVFTAENFKNKAQVFEQIAKQFPNQKIVSVGDQVTTDLIPAQQAGLSTYLVTKPADLLALDSNYD